MSSRRGGKHGANAERAGGRDHLSVLLNPGEASGKRVAAANGLRSALGSREAGVCIARHGVAKLLSGFEQLLHEKNEAIRKLTPALLGTLGAACRPDVGPFCSWFAAACAAVTAAAPDAPNGAARASGASLLIGALHECLLQLRRAKAAGCIAPFLPDLAGCARALLERMADPSLLTAFLPLLCTLGGGAEYAHGVRDHFAPMVDVILAWTLAPTADPALASAISTNFAELGHAWAGAANFGAGLLGSLTADAERTLAACAPSDGGGGGDMAGIDRAHRILGVISAVLAGLGPASFGALPDAPALAARSIAVLEIHVAAACVAGRRDLGGSALELAEGVVALLSGALGPKFAEIAISAISLLVRRISHDPDDASGTAAAQLRRLAEMINAQGSSLPAGAAHHFTGDATTAPFLRLRLHPDPAVVGALLGAYSAILAGGSHAAPVLVQGIISELRQVLVELSADTAEDPAEDSVGARPAAIPGSSASFGPSRAELSRHAQFHVALLSLVIRTTTTLPSLLSAAGALVRSAHPLRCASVAASPALRHAVLRALLGASDNAAVKVPPRATADGADDPVLSGLGTFLAELRRIILGVLGECAENSPSRAALAIPALRASAAALAPPNRRAISSALGAEIRRASHLGALIRGAARWASHDSDEVRVAALDALGAALSQGSAGAVDAPTLSVALRATISALGDTWKSAETREAAQAALATVSAGVLGTISRREVRQIAISAGSSTPHDGATSHANGVDDFRRSALSGPNSAGIGPSGLTRALRVMSGRAPAESGALIRMGLLGAEAAESTAEKSAEIGERGVVRTCARLATWQCALDAARFLVRAKLRSPYGGPKETFESLEKILAEALSTGADVAPGGAARTTASSGRGADGALTRRWLFLLDTFEHLERSIHVAADGALTLPPPPPPARVFFAANRRVCADYFSRIRTRLVRLAWRARQPVSVYRHVSGARCCCCTCC